MEETSNVFRKKRLVLWLMSLFITTTSLVHAETDPLIVAVCHRHPNNAYCVKQGLSQPSPKVREQGTNTANNKKQQNINDSTNQQRINTFCSKYKNNFENCRKVRPPTFAEDFCNFFHDHCPGAGELGNQTIVSSAQKPLNDSFAAAATNATTTTVSPTTTWANPFQARSGGVAANPQLAVAGAGPKSGAGAGSPSQQQQAAPSSLLSSWPSTASPTATSPLFINNELANINTATTVSPTQQQQPLKPLFQQQQPLKPTTTNNNVLTNTALANPAASLGSFSTGSNVAAGPVNVGSSSGFNLGGIAGLAGLGR